MKTIKSNFLIIVLLVLFSQNSYAQFNYKQWPTLFSAPNPSYVKVLNLGSVDTVLKKNTVFSNNYSLRSEFVA